jgi:hypothetical protein
MKLGMLSEELQQFNSALVIWALLQLWTTWFLVIRYQHPNTLAAYESLLKQYQEYLVKTYLQFSS